MLILGIESSCDETGASVVEINDTERIIRSNIIASQVDIHRLYGGVVPEIASRSHSEAISRITYEALETANVTLSDIDAIGVTNTPGLIGALLVGVNFAKALAYSNNIPLVAINHIRGHVAANYLEYKDLKPPFLALVASGGHTSIINVRSFTDFETVGRTRDYAIGEAFDKVGRVMGLPYPGGSEMDRLAHLGDSGLVSFPSAAISDDTLDFSFSGLKTAVINHLHRCDQRGDKYRTCDIAASFTRTVVDSVVRKTDMALRRYNCNKLVIAGGVAANSHLRTALCELAKLKGIDIFRLTRNQILIFC